MIESVNRTYNWIKEHGGSEPWPSTAIALALVAKDKKIQVQALKLYDAFRALDDYVDEHGDTPLQKAACLGSIMDMLNNPTDQISSTDFPWSFESERLTSSQLVNSKMAVRGFQRDLTRYKKASLSPTEAFDMRIRGIYPYISIACELFSDNALQPTNSNDFKNFLRLIEQVAISGDIRDFKEDMELGINKFTNDEQQLLAHPRDFQFSVFNKAQEHARAINRVGNMSWWNSMIVKNLLVYRIGIRAAATVNE